MQDNSDTEPGIVAIDYEAVQQLADQLAAQAAAMSDNLDQLSGGWTSMFGSTAGLAMTAASFAAGDSRIQHQTQIDKLEAASRWLVHHSENMKAIDANTAAELAAV
ncbi:MAG: hypothetical protein FWD63_02275 [Propionibacteriaceae bacterium]|nr:hypothetical protein [Propionibacteriaceae bacterium]